MGDFLLHSMIVCPDLKKDYPKISHGRGVCLYDETGKEYIDAAGASCAVTNIGYGVPGIGEAIKEQVDKISILPTHYFNSSVLDKYLEELVTFAGKDFTKAWLPSSGTEAVENAIKVAIQYHQMRGEGSRHKVIGRWNSYHGNSILTLDVGGMKFRRMTYKSLLHNHPHICPAYCYRCPLNLEASSCNLECASELERCILEEGPSSIAAFVVEPVVGAALGSVPAPDGYFKEIRRICDKYGILLISDEVMTGFGRIGKNFGIQVWDVVPDIIAAGKGISGGYFPMSAVIMRSNVAEQFEKSNTPFFGGHTFACNPLGAAVGQFILEYTKSHKLSERAEFFGKIFMEKLQDLYHYEIIGNIRGRGLLLGIEFVSDRITKTPFPANLAVSKRIGEIALSKGVILYPGKGSFNGEIGDHILLAPPLVIKEEEIDVIVNVLKESIIEFMAELKMRDVNL